MTWHRSRLGEGYCLVCPKRAVVEVVDPVGDHALLCSEHWHDALDRSAGLIHAIRLYRPLPPTPEAS